MWVIIATVCSSINTVDCVSMMWKEQSFVTEQMCFDKLLYAQANLPDGTVSLDCFAVPGQSNV
jgi:hypothetical protein